MKLVWIIVLLFPAMVFAKADQEAIRRVIRQHLGEVKSCYEASLAQNPGLTGKIVMDFEINDTGAVKKAEVNESKSSLKDLEVRKCLTDKFLTWKFKAAPKGELVAVSYPFEFSK